MAPGSDERHPPPPPHTGTVPKTKVRNCVVPQEAVTPTRRDINSANLASSSLDWVSVPVSDYNPRPNYTQSSRKTTNSSADHDYSDLDTALQRFVPVRPQPRGLPLPMQPPSENGDDSAHGYHHSTPNGVSPHSNANHGAAAVMIVNPTTPNTLTGMSNQYNQVSNSNRNNLTRSLHARNTELAGSSQSLSSQHTAAVGARGNNKTNNISAYQPPAGHRAESMAGCPSAGDNARMLGDALVTSCPDPASVERRLGQIREYIRVTSSLVDTMRNSEDEQEVTERNGTERAAKFCKLLDQLALSNVPEMSTNSHSHAPTNYHDGDTRPMSVQSTGSAYSDSELWQSELKNKMEVSQQRLAALQDQQKRLLKYQAEAKQHLADMHNMSRARQTQDNLQHQPTAPMDNTHAQNHMFVGGHQHTHRMYNSNQIGVATTLPQTNHSTNLLNSCPGGSQDVYGPNSVAEADSTSHGHVTHRSDDRYNSGLLPHVEHARDSDEDEGPGGSAPPPPPPRDPVLSAQGLELQNKLRDLQRKKQHMENLVAEFQKLQAAERLLGGGGGSGGASGGGGGGSTHARNTYSSDDSGGEEDTTHNGMKSDGNMKNEDPFKLMEISAIKAALEKTKDLMRTVERYEPDAALNEDFQLPTHSNINDNKSEGGRSAGEWSTEGSVCRSIRNTIQPGKLTNHPPHTHEASLSSLQLLATHMRREAETLASERQRIQQTIARNKAEGSSGKLSQKTLLRSSAPSLGRGGAPSPQGARGRGGRRDEKELSNSAEVQNMKPEQCSYSAMNQSYNSEQEEGESQNEDVMFTTHPHSQPDRHHYQSGDGNVYESASHPLPPAAAANYYSDSDTGSRSKADSRSLHLRRNRHSLVDRPIHEHVAAVNAPCSGQSDPPPHPHPMHAQPDSASSSPSFPPPMAPPPPHPPAWASKSNQDARSNQFTQNSHSQTSMERLLGSQLSFPSVPFNMMMPYGVMGAGACACWGPWCWQQLAAQQRDIHQLREQLNSLEERWRAETAPHALNNQVPPGNRANNYWDNFRSYSRQNLLSMNSKTNAESHLGSAPPQHPHPLTARSHNTLHPPPPTAPAPAPTPPKRNTNRNNLTFDSPHPFQSAPDVLNLNQNMEEHANINREERNINRTEPIPEIIQAHSNNLNRSSESLNMKKKSSSKLPAKNSANRRNYSLDFVQNSNINIASTSDTPNPNLASTSRDKATAKMFDLLRENVYSEVTALISANESHPDFLIQLFRELQNVSSDSLRQNALLLIRNLSNNVQTGNTAASSELESVAMPPVNIPPEDTNSHADQPSGGNHDGASSVYRNIIDFMIFRGEDVCNPDLLEAFKAVIIDAHREAGQNMPYSQKKLQEFLSKYEGMRLREVSGDIIDDLLSVPASQEGREESRGVEGIMQDVAGCLSVEVGGRLDLLESAEVYNGDLAEADQTCPSEPEPLEADLPDVVEAEEITPTEAEAEWLGLDRVPTRLHMDDSPANQKD